MNILPAFSFVIDGVLFSFSNMNMKYSNTACSRVLNILSHHLHCEDISGQRDNAAAAKSHQSCPTLCDPIDGSPPGSPLPLDSPGKNTGVGYHFLLQCMKVKSESEVTQSCLTL